MNFLSGWKTYLTNIVLIGDQVVNFMNGKESLDQAIPIVLTALGMMFLRNGVNTAAK